MDSMNASAESLYVIHTPLHYRTFIALLTHAPSISAVRIDTSLTLAAFCEHMNFLFGGMVVLSRRYAAILYYDYALTVFSEIEYFWNPPSFSPSFALFAVSRYFGLLGPIPVFFEYFGVYPEHVSLPRLSSTALNTR